MRKLCSLVIVLAVIAVGVGFYRGWFSLSSSRYVEGHKTKVNLTVDEDKMKQDGEQLKEKARELTGQSQE